MSMTEIAGTGIVDAERADLLEVLAKSRHFLRFTTRDLSDKQAGERTTASELTLGGLVKHVTLVERNWANFIVRGPSAMGDFSAMTPEDYAVWNEQFQMMDGETLDGVLASYAGVARATDDLVRGLPDLNAAAAAERPVVPAWRAVVGPPRVHAHHRGDHAARRSRGHHPRIA